MKTFRDKNGIQWEFSVNLQTVKRMKELLGINVFSGDVWQTLSDDIVSVIDCVYVACKDQADRLGITDIKFGESIDSNEFESLADKLILEIIDFFPSRRKEAAMKLYQNAKKVQEINLTMIAKMPTFTDEKMKAATEKLSELLTSTQESSE